MKRTLVAAVSALALVAAAAALAAKPGPGTPTGVGTVFLPNPVAELGDQTLTDRKDADYPALASAYHDVALTDLDGSGFLRGAWAVIVSETGNPAYSPTNTFRYHRNQDEFEQVMAYYWVTAAQRYIQSLGFGTSRRPVNREPQRLRINQWGVDNSFATEKKDEIRLGKGGVDDAEDAEVILHEYGHAIHFAQNFSFSTTEAGAISEGFGDYWAATVADVVAPTPDPACVADWDSVSYTSTVPHCLRRVDRDLTYPDDLTGAVHADGRIWSRALWDIRAALGHVRADTIILEGQFGFAGGTMPALAERTVAAAQRLYGTPAATAVRAAFAARGIV
ncbi:MAG TPA: M36 family metallopeptidase [Gaiellaceae bacterium]|nr:M36 family metallopeptidase [Gaiellaceae bacterium]